jgi:hypothetical protein
VVEQKCDENKFETKNYFIKNIEELKVKLSNNSEFSSLFEKVDSIV